MSTAHTVVTVFLLGGLFNYNLQWDSVVFQKSTTSGLKKTHNEEHKGER